MRVSNFDSRSVVLDGTGAIPLGARAYVVNATMNGVPLSSTCHFDFSEVFKTGGELVLGVSANQTVGCLGAGSDLLPHSLSTGGFA